MSGLFAIAKLKEPYGNMRTLKIRISDDGELFYRLHCPTSRISHALSNLQLKIPLPDMRENTVSQTLAEIRKSLSSGVVTVENLRLACPHDVGRKPESKQDFLQFIYDRLHHVHNENKNTDYMRKLKAIVEAEK